MSLRRQLETWLLVRLIAAGFERLEAHHLGHLLDAALDRQYGEQDSEAMQAKLVAFLKSVIAELEDDPHAAG